MSGPDFNLAVSVLPHKGPGRYAQLDSGLAGEGVPALALEAFWPNTLQSAELDLDANAPTQEFGVSNQHLDALRQLAASVQMPFTALMQADDVVAGDHCSLRLRSGSVSACLSWRGATPAWPGSAERPHVDIG
jgi:hypothetical protein